MNEKPWIEDEDAEEQPAERAEPFEEPPEEPEVQPEREAIPRSFAIQRHHLERFGYSVGCRKCSMLQRGDHSRPNLAHDRPCRLRIMRAMERSPELNRRVQESERRKQDFQRIRQARGPAEEPSMAAPPDVAPDPAPEADDVHEEEVAERPAQKRRVQDPSDEDPRREEVQRRRGRSDEQGEEETRPETPSGTTRNGGAEWQ